VTYEQALKCLQHRPTADIRLKAVDATRSHHSLKRVWLDSDGVLTMSHPTDKGTCSAPKDGEYTVLTKLAKKGQLIELLKSNSIGVIFVEPSVIEYRVVEEDEELPPPEHPFYWRVSNLS
jgi:hypothetical protein